MIEHEALPLLPVPGVAPTQPRSVPKTMPVQQRQEIRRADWVQVENNMRLRDERDRRSTPKGGKSTIAAMVGGVALEATVASGADTRVAHDLGRVPEAIVFVEPTGTPGDVLTGRPEGGFQAGGGNATSWDERFVFVRSNVASPGRVFRFIVG